MFCHHSLNSYESTARAPSTAVSFSSWADFSLNGDLSNSSTDRPVVGVICSSVSWLWQSYPSYKVLIARIRPEFIEHWPEIGKYQVVFPILIAFFQALDRLLILT